MWHIIIRDNMSLIDINHYAVPISVRFRLAVYHLLTFSAVSDTHCKSSTERFDPCTSAHTSKTDAIVSIDWFNYVKEDGAWTKRFEFMMVGDLSVGFGVTQMDMVSNPMVQVQTCQCNTSSPLCLFRSRWGSLKFEIFWVMSSLRRRSQLARRRTAVKTQFWGELANFSTYLDIYSYRTKYLYISFNPFVTRPFVFVRQK